jgi:hypothetical protein
MTQNKHFMDEPDIGSGEKNAGQLDVEKDVRSVDGTLAGEPLDGRQYQNVVEEQFHANMRPAPEGSVAGRILQEGDHIARILAQPLGDDTFEAQVYVRLAREPEIAETYIPAGTFVSEDEAWKAAEERATRAFREHEF